MPLLDEYGVVDLRGHMADCWPRLLWQAMFDLYRAAGGNLDRMDNMLIDLKCCVSACEGIGRGGAPTFLWAFSPRSGFTSFLPDTENDVLSQMSFEYRYRIAVDDRSFRFERITDGLDDTTEEV